MSKRWRTTKRTHPSNAHLCKSAKVLLLFVFHTSRMLAMPPAARVSAVTQQKVLSGTRIHVHTFALDTHSQHEPSCILFMLFYMHSQYEPFCMLVHADGRERQALGVDKPHLGPRASLCGRQGPPILCHVQVWCVCV